MLPEGTLCELIEGEVYMTPSPNSRHQILVGRLFTALQSAIDDQSIVLVSPIDVVLASDATLQPDVVFVSERSRSIVQDVVRGVPDLVIEVLSPSTAKRDRGIKMETYARHGVGECWMVSDESPAIEIYRLDTGEGAYRLHATRRAGDRADTPLLPRLRVDVAALFHR
jgi:Uma2 family endonuclease